MSFLQPALLFALPIVLLPIIIHLINQRRFQTVHWAAMQFLLAANRVSQGYARIRRWLILAARVAAIAGLVFAISRPLSSGWLGLAGGGKIDTAIVLIDRSPSMTMRDSSGLSKLDSGLGKIADSLTTLQPTRIVLIDSANGKPLELDSAAKLLELPQTRATSKSADLPAMMEVVNDYVVANQPSRCDVWICSDVRRHDWNHESGRWDAVRQAFQELPQVIRFHLLAHTATTNDNRTIRVSETQRIEARDGSQLLLSLNIRQDEQVDSSTTIPIQLELNGARSEMSAEVSGSRTQLHNHTVPIDSAQSRGWGRVSLGPDTVPADNEFYFVYDRPIERKSVIVADSGSTIEPLEFAASGSSDADVVCSHKRITPENFIGTDLADIALVIWHSAIPSIDDPAHALLESFANRGGQIIFFPPETPTDTVFAGIKWTQWKQLDQVAVTSWVGDQDLLGRTLVGEALPVGELSFSSSCGVDGDYVSLAQVDQGLPILVRAMANGRNVYFCTTTVASSDSTLAENGVVLYAMIHRALAEGIESLGATGMTIAGESAGGETLIWQRIAGDSSALSTEYGYSAGVYSVGERLVAINRSVGEDLLTVLDDDQVAELFAGLDFDRVEIGSGDSSSLVQEIWRLCLVLMLVALIAEAALCIPSRAGRSDQQSAGASFA
jgi:hypothetical protein